MISEVGTGALVSGIWIGGVVLTLATVLAILAEPKRRADGTRAIRGQQSR